MLCRRALRCRPVIQLFLIIASGDPMVFYTREFSGSARDRSQVFHWQVKTDIAIKFPISRMPRISFVRTPDLTGRSGITCEGGGPGWCITGSVNGAVWGRRSKEQSVSVD